MEIDLQPYLENELIQIRPLRAQDYEQLFLVANDPLIWEQHPVKNRYEPIEFEKFFKESLRSNGALVIIDKANEFIIGSSRFKKIDSLNVVEIGWTFLSRAYWGSGYNRMVKTLMLDHIFQFVQEVLFYVSISNIRSRRAVEKIGGRLITSDQYKSNTHYNDLVYRILKEEYYKHP